MTTAQTEISSETPVFERLERPHSEYLDGILGLPHFVLDKGFLRVIDYMGDEASVIQAARVSYGKGTKKTSEDRGLLRYLLSHSHTTPFEMNELKLHVKMPIFVARQWIRHRTASVNEYSARYSELSREFYIPDASDICAQSTNNKQGRGETFDQEKAQAILKILLENSEMSFDTYDKLLDSDLSRELARIGVTLNTYTEFYWKIDLHNLMHFMRLRIDAHAQKEIRVYAEVMGELLKGWCPNIYEAWRDYSVDCLKLASFEVSFVRDMMKFAIDHGFQPVKPTKASKREWEALQANLNI